MGTLISQCSVQPPRQSPSPRKNSSGMQDSTCNPTKTSTSSSNLLDPSGTPESFDTFLSEVLRSAPVPTRTINRSDTFMSPSSSTTLSPSQASSRIGISSKATVTISYLETEICLTPDGEITISKPLAKPIPVRRSSTKKVTSQPMKKKTNLLQARKKKSEKLTTSLSTCEE